MTQSGHTPLSDYRFRPIRYSVLNLRGGNEAARVHDTDRRHGCVAAWGARAAGETANHRIPGLGHSYNLGHMDRRLHAAVTRTWLDREPHDRHRVSLGRG